VEVLTINHEREDKAGCSYCCCTGIGGVCLGDDGGTNCVEVEVYDSNHLKKESFRVKRRVEK